MAPYLKTARLFTFGKPLKVTINTGVRFARIYRAGAALIP